MYAAGYLVEKISAELCTVWIVAASIPPQCPCIHISIRGLDGTPERVFRKASPPCTVNSGTELCGRDERFVLLETRSGATFAWMTVPPHLVVIHRFIPMWC